MAPCGRQRAVSSTKTESGKSGRAGSSITVAPVLRSAARGDMYVQVAVETPQNLTKRQQDLLKEFEGTGGADKSHSPESAGFFAKVKELWDDLRG